MTHFESSELETLSTTLGWGGEIVSEGELSSELRPVNSFNEGLVSVFEFEPDFGELDTQTVSNLMQIRIPPIGFGEAIATFSAATKVIKKFQPSPGRYANPECLLLSSVVDEQFVSAVYEYRRRWMNRLKKCLADDYPFLIGTTKRERSLLRQLVSTGVLLLQNKHVYPNRWPPDPLSVKVGERFGRLQIKRLGKGGICECVCDCNKSTQVRIGHLLTGRTKSCGCLKLEHEEKAKRGKQTRRMIHNGKFW